MPLHHKTIVTEGRYWIPSLNGGKGGFKDIDGAYLRKIAATAQKQREAGHKIPAPWKHDPKAVPVTVGDASDGALETAYDNGGFWEVIWPSTLPDGRIKLEGLVDAPGSPDDPDSAYAKIGTQVKDTSISIAEKWRDGKGVDWEEPVMHIALCTHPIEPGQENFKPVNGGMTIAMSLSAKVPVTDVLASLRDKAGITLPDDTTEDNLMERLYIALLQKTSEDTGTTTSPPNGARERQPSTLAMAFSKEQLEGLLQVTNPATGKPYTQDELKGATGQEVIMATPTTSPSAPAAPTQPPSDSRVDVLMSMLNQSEGRRRVDRVEALVKSGRISVDYAKTTLAPMLEGFQMSFGADGKPLPHSIDMVLDALEAQPAPVSEAAYNPMNELLGTLAMSQPPHGSQLVNLPVDEGKHAWESTDALNKHLDSVFGQ